MGLYKLAISERASFLMEEDADLVVRSLRRGDAWERTALARWEEASRGLQGTVLDIGAYTGIYSLLAAKASESVSVEAFEPHLPVFYRLRENICANALQERIKPHNIALSDRSGTGALNITGTSALPSGSSIDPHPDRKTIASAPVFMRTGDSLFTNEKIVLIKIDAERHELAIIEGLRNTLRRCQPICFIEILDADALAKTLALMGSFGYERVELVCEDLKATVADDRIYRPQKDRTNYIFRPSAH